jgi:hypothetical protein
VDNSDPNAWRNAALPFVQYRPKGADNPLAAGNVVTQAFLASFDDGCPIDFRHTALRTGQADASQLKVFDYLGGGSGAMFFIASMPASQTVLAVECNRTLTFVRAQTQTEVGAVSRYEGTTTDTETPLMSKWPASVLQGASSEAFQVMPAACAQPSWWTILVPSADGIVLRSGDFATDDLDRRYVISSAELTRCGWRITAQQVRTVTSYFCTASTEPLVDAHKH